MWAKSKKENKLVVKWRKKKRVKIMAEQSAAAHALRMIYTHKCKSKVKEV